MNASEWGRVATAIGRVLADSTRTAEIHVVAELTGRAAYESYLRSMRSDSSLGELMSARPELCSSQVDYGVLRELPASTLGGAYVRHLDENGLSADSQAAPTTYIKNDDVAYLMRRFRQTHDVWHTLLGLGAKGHEEVLIHGFSFGQLRLPVSALVVVFGSLKHFIGEGRFRSLAADMPRAYRMGRDAEPLLPVFWERHWHESLAEIRHRYRVVELAAG